LQGGGHRFDPDTLHSAVDRSWGANEKQLPISRSSRTEDEVRFDLIGCFDERKRFG
jgi:hypothetical protein